MTTAITRDRLLEVSARIRDVQLGKGLLEKKRDAVLRVLEEERRRYIKVQETFRNLSRRLGILYGMIRIHDGVSTIQLLRLQRPLVTLRCTRESVMGCRYSVFEPEASSITRRFPLAMDPALSCLYVDDFLELIAQSESLLWEFVTLRSKIQSFERELKKTNLKINTLEHDMLPSLSAERKKISETLSERERQERYAVKKLTKKKRRT